MKRHRTCKSCERSLRKGSSRRALVMQSDGSIEHGLVCARCALRACAFVVPPPTTIPTPCKSPGCKGRSAYCTHCYERVAKQASDAVKVNVATVWTTRGESDDGCD